MALSGSEIIQVTGIDNLGRPSGATEVSSISDVATFTVSGAIKHYYFGAATYVAAGSSQSDATILTTDMCVCIPTGAGQGVVEQPVAFGAQSIVINAGAFNLNLYPAVGNNINSLATNAAWIIPPGYATELVGVTSTQWSGSIGNVPPAYAYNSNIAIGSAVLSGANLVGGVGFQDVTLAMTGALTGAATATLPSVANLQAVIYNPFINQSWRFRFINESTNNSTWTIASVSGWSTGGTLTVAQNTWRDFYITQTAAASYGFQSIGTGTYS